MYKGNRQKMVTEDNSHKTFDIFEEVIQVYSDTLMENEK